MEVNMVRIGDVSSARWLLRLGGMACKFLFLAFSFPAILSQQPYGEQGRLIIEVSRSHSDTTVGRTPLDEGSARRRDLYLTVHSTGKRHVRAHGGIRTAVPTSERPQTPVLDRSANCIGLPFLSVFVCLWSERG